MIVFRKASRFRFAPRTFDFRLEIFFWFSFKKQIKGKVSVLSFLAKASLVMVLQLFKVKLTDGFAEFDCPFSPVFYQSNIAWCSRTRHFLCYENKQ
jgi:hypothetical protein